MSPEKIVSGTVIGAVLPAVKQSVNVTVLKFGQGANKLKDVAADSTHLIKWQADVDSNMHNLNCTAQYGERKYVLGK